MYNLSIWGCTHTAQARSSLKHQGRHFPVMMFFMCNRFGAGVEIEFISNYLTWETSGWRSLPNHKDQERRWQALPQIRPPMAPVQSICWIFVFDRTHFLPTKKEKKNRQWGESKVILPCQFVIEIGHKAFLARRCVEYLFDPLHLGWVKSHLKSSHQVNFKEMLFLLKLFFCLS